MFTLSVIRYGERITEEYETLDLAIDAAVMILDENLGYVEGVITRDFNLIEPIELFEAYQSRIKTKLQQGESLTNREASWSE